MAVTDEGTQVNETAWHAFSRMAQNTERTLDALNGDQGPDVGAQIATACATLAAAYALVAIHNELYTLEDVLSDVLSDLLTKEREES